MSVGTYYGGNLHQQVCQIYKHWRQSFPDCKELGATSGLCLHWQFMLSCQRQNLYQAICYHCQKIGHLAKDSAKKDLEPNCLYCSQAHRSASCPNKQNSDMQVCSNSSHRKTFLIQNKHRSNSHECPFIKQELARLQQKIDYTSKNVIGL